MSDDPSSPNSGGYHIRIASQGSISSLGTQDAGAESDVNPPLHHVGMQQPPPSGRGMPPHPNSNGYNQYGYNQYGMQQQQPQQQYGMQPPPQPQAPQQQMGGRGVRVNQNSKSSSSNSNSNNRILSSLRR